MLPIEANEVTAEKIKENAVEESKIKALAVTEGKLGSEAVAEGKIKALAVSEGKLAAEAVAEGKIKNLAVSEGKLAAEAVSEAKLKKEAVSTAKLIPPSAAPAKGAEKAVVVGTSSPARKIAAVVTGDAAKKEWAVTHNLNTPMIAVEALSPETEPARVAIEKVVAKSANEAVITLTAALGAGVAGYLIIIG